MTLPPREAMNGSSSIVSEPAAVGDPAPATAPVPAGAPLTGLPKVDGRRLRSERTHNAIVDATLALVEEGDLKPTAPRVAKRAAVSLRTVFQHFADVEQLFAAMLERQVDRVAATIRRVDPALPLPERLRAYAHQRCQVLEQVTPVARAAMMQEPLSERIHVQVDRLRARARDEVLATFASELGALPDDRRHVLLSCLLAASTWRMWEILRSEQLLDADAAEAVVVHQLSAVLAAEGYDASPDT